MPSTSQTPGLIEPETLYELNEAMARTGWGKTSFRSARRQGLPVKYLGRKAYVLGSDLIDFIQNNGRNER